MYHRRVITLTRPEARAFLVAHLGLGSASFPNGALGVRALLDRLRCIQLDPLDPMGTNADLVALARVDGIARGDVYRHLLPGHAFEHFAKERCLLPASAFPWYRDQAAETPWWRLGDRLKRLPDGVVEAVLADVHARGPALASDLVDHGAVERIDWSGWRGTGKATAMALEVLWTRCQVVVCGREGNAKRFDVPKRALPGVAALPAGDFASWAVGERAHAAGLLSRASGAQWSMLSDVRISPLIDAMLAAGRLDEVRVEGASRTYLAPPGLRETAMAAYDDRMRILGPLDPLLWDRKLVKDAFGFDYIWEVYKPAEKRRFGWYVCPLLFRGALVGRLEGRVRGDTLAVDRIWPENGVRLDEDALDLALERHATACGVSAFTRPAL